MVEVAKLVGMELRDYKDEDGKARQFCGLHLVHVKDSVKRIAGCKVEAVRCPRDVDPRLLEVGKTYQLDYEHVDTKNGKMAFLVDLLPVEK